LVRLGTIPIDAEPMLEAAREHFYAQGFAIF
jgi:hypothetical protein